MSIVFLRPFGRPVALAVSALLIASGSASAATVVDRDEFSTTVDAGGGKLKTTLSSEPLNYQSESGAWKPIDLRLEAQSDGTVRPQSVDGDLAIPESLGSPVELEHDGRTATLRLLGASGDVDVTGAEAAYEAAMPGVDVSYVARPYGVKETLTLASPLAPRSFAYELRASELWSASMDRGDVILRDSAGTERYRISAPLAWDSAQDPAFTNALALSVGKLADGRWRVTLRPDEAWLADTARVYPVTIDPDFSWSNGTTHFNGAQDCYLSGYTQANNTFCAQTYLQTGWYNRPYRSIFKFDIAAAIPSNATVSSAVFKAYAPPATPHIAMGHSLHTITSDWDSTATWNNRKAGTPWTTSGGGGDISTNPAYSSSSTSVQAYPAWYSWNAPLAAVQGWVNGSLPNYGFMLRSDNTGNIGNAYAWASTEASTSSQFPADSTKWPNLDVTWSAGIKATGERAVWQQPALALPDGGRLSVNAANGAAFLQPYGGVDTFDGACYEALPQFNSAEPARLGAFGIGFESSAEQIRTVSTAGGIQLRGPTGWQVSAAPADRADSAFQTGVDLQAGDGTDLIAVSTGEKRWSVPAPSSGEDGLPTSCWDGDASIPLVRDGSRRLIEIGAAEEGLSMSRSSAGTISEIRRGSDTPTSFQYDTAGRLVRAELRDLDVVDIVWHVVGGVSVPGQLIYESGGVLSIAWSSGPSGPAVSSATLNVPGEQTRELGFSGSGPSRVLTGPDGSVPAVGDPNGLIAGPDTAGPEFEWDNDPDEVVLKYSSTGAKLQVSASVSDALSGLADVRLVNEAGATIATFPISCHGAWGCDRSLDLAQTVETFSGVIDPLLPIYLRARDQAGNVTEKPVIALEKDSAPGMVTEPAVFESEATPDGQQGTIMWQAPDEANAPPSVRSVRWRVGTGPWTQPQVDSGEATVTVPTAGDLVTFEFSATNQLNGLETVQIETVDVNAIADYQPLPESNVDPEFAGPASNRVEVTLRTTLSDGREVPVVGVLASFVASGTRSKDGTDYVITQRGAATTDAEGKLVIENAISEGFTVTVGDEDFEVASGAGLRAVTFAATSPGGTLREKRYCLASEQLTRMCFVIDAARRRAQRVVPAYWTNPQSESTRANALSHAYWNAEIERNRHHQPAVYWPHHWDLANVRDFMTLHEWDDQHSSKIYDRRSSKMDYWNNAKGREMGRNRKDWDVARLCRAVVNRSFGSTIGYFFKGSLSWRKPPVPGRFVYITPSRLVKRRIPPGSGCNDLAHGSRTSQVASSGSGGAGAGGCDPATATWYNPETGICTF